MLEVSYTYVVFPCFLDKLIFIDMITNAHVPSHHADLPNIRFLGTTTFSDVWYMARREHAPRTCDGTSRARWARFAQFAAECVRFGIYACGRC